MRAGGAFDDVEVAVDVDHVLAPCLLMSHGGKREAQPGYEGKGGERRRDRDCWAKFECECRTLRNALGSFSGLEVRCCQSKKVRAAVSSMALTFLCKPSMF